jgi:uncharacterized membrane protein YraQ (UPF0718 family)
VFENIFNVWLPDFSFLFLSILVEGAPFILLGTIISGFIDVYLPAGAMDRLLPRNRSHAILVSGFLGIIFPNSTRSRPRAMRSMNTSSSTCMTMSTSTSTRIAARATT